jgi:hypothetical protein
MDPVQVALECSKQTTPENFQIVGLYRGCSFKMDCFMDFSESTIINNLRLRKILHFPKISSQNVICMRKIFGLGLLGKANCLTVRQDR